MEPLVPWPVPLLAALLLGWLLGSFLNQLVDRSPPRRATAHGAAEAHPAPAWPGLLHPRRSICFQCRRPIPWHDNVPVFAYLWLRGQCRHCGGAIGQRTLWMEVATPLLWAGLVWLGAQAELRLPVLVLLLALAAWGQVALLVWWEGRQVRPWLWGAGLAAVPLAALVLWLA